jgi:hypothetical protein
MAVSKTAAEFLSSIKTKGSGHPSKNILYGVEGVGKTSLCSHAMKPFFIMCAGETGLLTLIDNGLVPEIPHADPFSSWPVLMQFLELVAEGKIPDMKSLHIDSVGTAQNLMIDHLIETECKGSRSRYSDYGHGVKISTPVWREFLAVLDRINRNGVQIWLLGHTVVQPFKNPEGSDYHRYSLQLQDAISELTRQWADNIFFLNYHTEADKGKGLGGTERYLYANRTPAFDAKNRCGLKSLEGYPLSGNAKDAWNDLITVIKEARAK